MASLLRWLNLYNPWPSCAALHAVGVGDLRLGFVACSSDCYGASLTDLLLALHCLRWTISTLSLSAPLSFPPSLPRQALWQDDPEPQARAVSSMRLAVLATLTCNSLWSIFGALIWLQPAGDRTPPFDMIFRLNGLTQACLIASWWCVLSEILRGLASVPNIVSDLIKCFAVVHASCFALRNLECAIEDYVLCGGANVTPPLGALWLIFVLLCRRHSLLSRWLADLSPSNPPHPLLIGMLCGFVYWIGNSAILIGTEAGLALWSHTILQAVCRLVGLIPPDGMLHRGAFEEMACFHLFGMLGNEMLFRAFWWLAKAEANALVECRATQRKAQAKQEAACLLVPLKARAVSMAADANVAPRGAAFPAGCHASASAREAQLAKADSPLGFVLDWWVGLQGPPRSSSRTSMDTSSSDSSRHGSSQHGGNEAEHAALSKSEPNTPTTIFAAGKHSKKLAGNVSVVRRWRSAPEWLETWHSRPKLFGEHPAGPWLTSTLHASQHAGRRCKND